MKKLLLIVPVAALGFTGCVVYQPSPISGQYGYTYDFQVPIAEGIPAPVGVAAPVYSSDPVYSRIPEPQRTASFAPTLVVADVPPSPPTMPPIVSSIPEMTPRPIIQNRTTTMIYPQPQQPQVIQEAAGANINSGAQQPAAVAPGYIPSTAVYSGGLPGFIGTNEPPTNAPTNGIPTNGIPTNGIPTNGIPTNGIPTNGIPTNSIPTNPFAPLPGTNVQPTNAVPQQLDAAPRLDPAQRFPQQPRIPEGETPLSSPNPTTVTPVPPAPPAPQPPATQPQAAQPFAPVAPPAASPAAPAPARP